MHSTARRWLLAFAVLGLITSGTSTYVHYQLLRDRGYTSFCDINSTITCTESYLSSYGSFAGVPVALLGFLWFVLAALLAWVALKGRGEARDSAPGYLFVLSTIGLAVVLYLGYAAFFVLKAVCVLCVGTYVAVIGLFVTSGNIMDFPMTTLPKRFGRDMRRLLSTPSALITALVFVGGAASAIASFPRDVATTGEAAEGQAAGAAAAAAGAQQPASQQSEFERWYYSQPIADPGVPHDGAKVLVVKFNDYQCPACAQSYYDYKAIFAKYQAQHPGAVRIVTKDYPLDPECNFNAPGGSHMASCEAAAAVRLAERKGKGDEMSEWLYTNSASLTPQSVRQAAAAIGGVPDFDAQYAQALQGVRGDVAVGGAIGIRSTPTFVINGRVLNGALPAQYFDQAIAIELQRAGVKD
jgi:uncharacterized membrane protein/protein-disulfide isomerase